MVPNEAFGPISRVRSTLRAVEQPGSTRDEVGVGYLWHLLGLNCCVTFRAVL